MFLPFRWHLVDLGVVMLLNLLDEHCILGKNEVDSSTLSSQTTSSTDSVDVVLLSEGKLVVYDETDLLDIDTSGEEIGCDEDTD